MGPKKDDKSSKKDIVISTPQSFEDLVPILQGIQSSVTSTNSQISTLIKQYEVLEKKFAESEARVTEAEERVVVAEEKLEAVTTKLDTITANYAALQLRIQQLEVNENYIQQRFRLRSIRVYNMGREVKNSREAALYLYDSILRRALTDPVSGNDPGCFRVVEFCHILPPMPGKEKKFPGYNYILQFTTRYFKQSLFDVKKNVVDTFNRANGEKIKVSHDFTYLNRKCLAALHEDKEVKRVTFRSDKVMYKTEEEGPWKPVVNPFGKNAAEMSQFEPDEPVQA